MKTRKYSALLALVVLVIAVLAVCPILPIQVMAISVVPRYSINSPLEIRVLSYTIPIPRMVVSAVPSIYFADDLVEITTVIGTSFQISEKLLLTARTVAGGIVASIIIIVATTDRIEKVISTARRRLIFGHNKNKGPPYTLVWLFSLATTLKYMIVYFTDILTRHGNMEVDTATTDGKPITDSPFSLGVTNDEYITAFTLRKAVLLP